MTHQQRMDKIIERRGRTPIQSTAHVEYREVTTKSRAGVEYTKFIPKIIPNEK